jgi:hypothetical protein
VQAVGPKDGAKSLLIQLVGWQGWAGTQLISAVQLLASARAVVTAGAAGDQDGSDTEGDDKERFCIHMQRDQQVTR